MRLVVKACVLCDDVRPELGGKATIIGYSGILPGVELAFQSMSSPVHQIMFLFAIDSVREAVKVHLEIYAPDGKLLSKSNLIGPLRNNPDANANVAIAMRNLLLEKPGTYAVKLFVEGNLEYETSFRTILKLSETKLQ